MVTTEMAVTTVKPLAECWELNKAGVDVSDDICHYLKEAVDEYGQLGAECADLYFLYGDNMLRLAQIAGKNNFTEELRRKRSARAGGDHAAAASAAASSAADPDLTEVNELFEISWENLDVARVIYEREASTEKDPDQKRKCQIKLAEINIRLADNNCERLLIDAAVELYQQALKLRTALKLAPQLIAETNICIGNAYTYKEQYKTAKKFYLIAKEELSGVSGLETMLSELQNKIGSCSVGNLNIVAEASDDAATAAAEPKKRGVNVAFPSAAAAKNRAKIESATVVQVRKKARVD